MKRLVLLGLLAACSKSEKKEPAPAPGTPGVIRGEIDVKPELKANLTASHVVFVSAKKGQGGGPPLAAKRMAVGTFPIQFELSAADQMIAGGPPLEGDVEITVRFDADSDVMTRQPGDLVWKGPATVGGPAMKLVVSEVVP